MKATLTNTVTGERIPVTYDLPFDVLLARRIKSERMKNGWTQEQLAQACDCCTRTISEIERCAANSRISTIRDIERALGCQLVEVVRG